MINKELTKKLRKGQVDVAYSQSPPREIGKTEIYDKEYCIKTYTGHGWINGIEVEVWTDYLVYTDANGMEVRRFIPQSEVVVA